MLKIWGRKDGSNVIKVMWCVGELGLEHERIDWGGPFGGNDDPAYRAKNPNGQLPTLEYDDGFTLWESGAVIRFLCAEHSAGRPEAAYVIERIIDIAAGKLGIDPVELRRRNTITPASMPFQTGRSFSYDCGAFEAYMDMVLDLAGLAGFEERRCQSASRGRLRGIGMSNTIERAAAAPKLTQWEGRNALALPAARLEVVLQRIEEGCACAAGVRCTSLAEVAVAALLARLDRGVVFREELLRHVRQPAARARPPLRRHCGGDAVPHAGHPVRVPNNVMSGR